MEAEVEDKLSEEDQGLVSDGLVAFADQHQSLDDNPYGPESPEPDERMAMLWRKGYLDGVRAEGRVAAKDGLPLDATPYCDPEHESENQDDCHEAWLEGWDSYTNDLLATQAKTEKEKPLSQYLNELEDACKAAEDDWQSAKKEAGELKKVFEAAVLRLRGAVRQSKAEEPLFSQPPTEADSAIKPSDPPPPSNDWRKAGIDVLGLTAKQQEKLVSKEIYTIGDLEDLRGCKGLRSIYGIGQATVDKIEDALLEWLSANRDAAVLQEAAA